MAASRSRRPTPSDLAQLALQLQRDEQLPDEQLLARDARIGRTIGDPGDDLTRLLAWLEQLHDDRAESDQPHATTAFRIVGLLLWVVGIVLGVGLATGVYWYDGSRPINIVYALAIFVLLPILLLIGFIVAAMPGRWLSNAPGIGTVHETLGLLSPGKLGWLVARITPQSYRDALTALVGRGQQSQHLFRGVQKWAPLCWSQQLALAIGIGATACFASLVFFTDLAFGWSTTLNIESGTFFTICRMVASPWSWALPAAAPDAALVEASRFYRLSGVDEAAAAELGAWWPFLLACMATYTLLPRFVTVAVARRRFHQAVAETMLHLPGVVRVLDRLASGQFDTRGEGDEPSLHSDADVSGSNLDAAAPGTLGGGVPGAIINWSDAPAEAARALQPAAEDGATPPLALAAGGSQGIDADRAAIDQCASLPDERSVAIVVRAWEPPMLEFLDFLRDLRGEVGRGRLITVVPAGSQGPPAPQDVGRWQRQLQKLGDARVQLVSLPEGSAAP